mgnify:CR=1 FL=1
MPRRKPNQPPGIPGRPAKDPYQKVGTPVRALVTPLVSDALVDLSKSMGIPQPKYGTVPSDIVRLGIWMVLEHYAKRDDLRDDESFKTLREVGLI